MRSFSLYDVFTQTAVDKGMAAFHKQLLWFVGQLLEVVFAKVHKGKSKAKLVVREVTWGDALGCAMTLDRKLVHYMEAGRRLASQQRLRSVSLCTDKASVGGLGGGVQTTLIVLGRRNIGIMAAPQAEMGWGAAPDRNKRPIHSGVVFVGWSSRGPGTTLRVEGLGVGTRKVRVRVT